MSAADPRHTDNSNPYQTTPVEEPRRHHRAMWLLASVGICGVLTAAYYKYSVAQTKRAVIAAKQAAVKAKQARVNSTEPLEARANEPGPGVDVESVPNRSTVNVATAEWLCADAFARLFTRIN